MASELQKPEIVRLVVGMSSDGYIDQTATSNWNSPEDWKHFLEMRDWADSIVMGRKTYEVNQGKRTIDPDKPRIVMTHQPEEFAHEAQPGLEFSGGTPAQILDELMKRGKNRTMIAGGVAVYSAFLDAGLIDEMFITKEPIRLKGSIKMPDDLTDGFSWLGHHQLNSTGTQLHKYVKTKWSK